MFVVPAPVFRVSSIIFMFYFQIHSFFLLFMVQPLWFCLVLFFLLPLCYVFLWGLLWLLKAFRYFLWVFSNKILVLIIRLHRCPILDSNCKSIWLLFDCWDSWLLYSENNFFFPSLSLALLYISPSCDHFTLIHLILPHSILCSVCYKGLNQFHS